MNALSQSYFEWFGLPERFQIDPVVLAGAYRAVQTRVHPDRYVQALDSERRMAMQMATQANEAYRTLQDPARRARYLCERQGVDLQIETNTAMPPAFLMQQMEWREALDDARAARDAGAIDGLRTQLDGLRRELLTQIGQAIDEQADFQSAAARVRQLMFIDRFATELDDVQDRLTDGQH